MSDIKKRFVNIEQVAEDFDVCTATINRWVEAGFFPAPLRFGRRKVWLRTSVEAFVEQKQKETKGATP